MARNKGVEIDHTFELEVAALEFANAFAAWSLNASDDAAWQMRAARINLYKRARRFAALPLSDYEKGEK